MSPETDEVFRDKVSEPRDGYFAEYSPVITGMPFASLSLVFTTAEHAPEAIRSKMENELAYWLKRYPVPLFVSSFDLHGDLIHLPNSSNLMGYLNADGQQLNRWGLFKEDELPIDQLNRAYLAKIYREIPYRYAQNVREMVKREYRFSIVAAFTIIFFTVVIPVLLELVSLGFEWLSYILEALSIGKGCYEIGKAFGWLKPSRREKAEAEKKSKMQHYFYHCERNPKAFERLKIENFQTQAAAKTLEEDATLRRR